MSGDYSNHDSRLRLSASTLNLRKTTSDEITQDRILCALEIAARVVALYGQRYLPVFERIERELEKLERQSSALNRALLIAKKFDAQNSSRIFDTQNGKHFGKQERNEAINEKAKVAENSDA